MDLILVKSFFVFSLFAIERETENAIKACKNVGWSNELIKKTKFESNFKSNIEFEVSITNVNRTVGAILSNEISKIHGADGLPKDTLSLKFKGTAGQSFGGFATHGLYMKVEGTANDYFGKGLSGATIVAQVPEKATFVPHENVIVGNVCLYGATAGEAYINGIAGERFCVRNSGASAVVEGIGDHGCEYMTGGTVVILGRTGQNFAAGMSGGVAYVYDPNKTFKNYCNISMVTLHKVQKESIETDMPQHLNLADEIILKTLIENHCQYTESNIANNILNEWDSELENFVKVMPIEYQRALNEMIETKKKEVA